MEIEGRIIEDLGTRSGVSARTSEPWRIAAYVIETESIYPRRMMFQVSDGRSNRIEQLNIRVGKRMRIHFEIAASKSSDGRWYNQITAYGAKDLDPQSAPIPKVPNQASSTPGNGLEAQMPGTSFLPYEGNTVTGQAPEPKQTKMNMPAEPAPAASNEAVPNDLPF